MGVLAALSISASLTACSDEPATMPTTESSQVQSTEPDSQLTSAEPNSPEAEQTNPLDMSAEGPETDGVIINDDLMVEKGYAQANP